MFQRLTRRRALIGATTAAAGLLLNTSDLRASSKMADGMGGGGGSSQATDGIVVTGTGVASAPVTSATIQYIVRYDSGSPMVSPADGTSQSSTPLTPDEETLAPIVAALVDAGVAEDKIKVFATAGIGVSYFGSGTAVVAAETMNPTLRGDLDAIVSAGAEAAIAAGLSIDQVGAVYQTDQCLDLNDQALAMAIEHANDQAASLAKALGVSLGELEGATMFPTYSPYSGYLPGSSGCEGIPGIDDAGTVYFPTYIASPLPQFTITASVTLTYDIA